VTTRRRALHRGLLAVDIVLVVAAIASLMLWRPSSSSAAAITIHRNDDVHFDPLDHTDPFFVLLVGIDGRPGLDGIRGDALHLVGINPANHSVTILNIPRDTWVNVPGFGMDKINGAYLSAGLQKQVETVSALTGVPIAFVVQTNFDGLQAMVDELGGIDVNVPYRMFDKNSGADFQPGINHMQGPGALAFSRNRHIPDGDIARTTNQAWLLISALQAAQNQTQSPFGTLRLLGMVARHTQYEGVGLHELYQLAAYAMTIDPSSVRNVTMPARVGKVGPADVVFVGPGADGLFADFRDDAVLQSH
jgi:LCP family protein required for cell wall assembly